MAIDTNSNASSDAPPDAPPGPSSGERPADRTLAAKYAHLRAIVGAIDHAVVAFSGGIDSSLVAFVAGQELGTRALAVTSASVSLKRKDLELAQRLAAKWGLSHRIVMTDELQKAEYRANPTNRCFYCKTSLYDTLTHVAREVGIATILNGTNTDDLGDHRPGLVAADDFHVQSPLVEAKFNKADIRALARHLRLENAEKPQAACLSSRFPYGTAITAALLHQVEAAEDVLDELGFNQYRVRHHGEVARLEIDAADLARALEMRDELHKGVRAAGYRFVALDLAGFRSGSLNEGLSAQERISVVQVHEPD